MLGENADRGMEPTAHNDTKPLIWLFFRGPVSAENISAAPSCRFPNRGAILSTASLNSRFRHIRVVTATRIATRAP
jgi:hypothetical protein